MSKQFRKADVNKSGFLSFDEIKKLCHRLNIKISKEKMQTLFNDANTDHDDKSSADNDDDGHGDEGAHDGDEGDFPCSTPSV